MASLVVAIVFVVGCNAQNPSAATTAPRVAPVASEPTAPASVGPSLAPAGPATVLPGEPDPTITPGVADPAVTQANIAKTICVSGYTTKVRPPASYTDDLKRQGLVAYRYSDTNLADYEEDHLISLEIGGAPRDPKNLWPEPYTVNLSDGRPVGAHVKDLIENKLHILVCAQEITLAAAQNEEASDWITAWFALDGQSPPPTRGSGQPAPTATPTDTPVPSDTPVPTDTSVSTDTPAPPPIRLVITSLTTPIHRGATAMLVARTAAHATCSIDVEYASGPSSAQGLGDKTANGSGVVTWSWKVGSRTTFGAWPVTVTCNVGDNYNSVEKDLVVH